MSKKYLNIGEHGLNGDFYRTTDGTPFRADNLEIATRIAFNDYLRGFDNLWREMSLVSIEPGKFTVDIYSLTNDPCHTHGEHRTETRTVEYYGPADMFTIEFEQDHCADPEYRRMIIAMETAHKNGSPIVRASNRTGRVMFSDSVRFPRFTPDGEWFPWENSYLNTDPKIARLQMHIAGINY